MPSFPKRAVTAIGGVLATNLGAVLGVNIGQAKSLGFDADSFFFAAGANMPSKLQFGAAYLYILGLLIALIGWSLLKFTEKPDEVVDTLPQLSHTLLGVFVGVVAVALGV